MLKVTLIKSFIGYDKTQRATVRALGLNKISSVAFHEGSAPVLGMLRKVRHLLKVEDIGEMEVVK